VKRKSTFEEMFERNTDKTLSIIKYIIETEINYDRDLETQFELIDKQQGEKSEKFEICPLTDQDILDIYYYQEQQLNNSLQVARLIYVIKNIKKRIIE
jgi:hypothetical protein